MASAANLRVVQSLLLCPGLAPSRHGVHACMQGLQVRAAFDKGAEARRRGAETRLAATRTEEEEAKVAMEEAAADAAHSRPALQDDR